TRGSGWPSARRPSTATRDTPGCASTSVSTPWPTSPVAPVIRMRMRASAGSGSARSLAPGCGRGVEEGRFLPGQPVPPGIGRRRGPRRDTAVPTRQLSVRRADGDGRKCSPAAPRPGPPMYLHQFFGNSPTPRPCAECQGDQRLDFDVRMAFQPIVDARDRSIHGYEALVRTMEGGSAADVLARVQPGQLYRFDQTCRVKAIATAAALGLQRRLFINFFPNAVYQPETCIRLTLRAAQMTGFPTSNLVFEAAESEQVSDPAHVSRIFRDYRGRGFQTAIDDFGAGYAGLSRLVEFQPDLIKLDMAL